MIALDTSALLAVVQGKDAGRACAQVLATHPLILSAATLAEVLIVAQHRRIGARIQALIDGLEVEIAPLSAADAHRATAAYARWGKGRHRAGLNYGDCFSYALATGLDIPLLFVGNDFAQTDVRRALP